MAQFDQIFCPYMAESYTPAIYEKKESCEEIRHLVKLLYDMLGYDLMLLGTCYFLATQDHHKYIWWESRMGQYLKVLLVKVSHVQM